MNEKIKTFSKDKRILWWGCGIVLLIGFFFTRLYQLQSLPAHLHIDEAGMGYDAWCLARYGVDRYGKSWPLYMTNFGSGQSSMYAFLCAELFKLFGFHVILLRIPIVIFSLINLVFGMLIAKELFQNRPVPVLLTGALLVFCPVFILQSRFGLDCSLMLGAGTCFLFFYVTALRRNTWSAYLIAGLIGGLSLYTYALSYLVLPIFLFLSFLILLLTKRVSIGKWFGMIGIMALIAAPLIWIQIINLFDLEEVVLWKFTLTKLVSYRSSELTLPSIDSFVRTITSIFAGDDLPYSSVPEYWNLYWISVPFFCFGLVHLIIKMRKDLYALGIVFWFASVFIVGCMIESNVNRINAIYTVTAIIAADGIMTLMGLLKKKAIVIPLCTVLFIGYAVGAGAFMNYYFGGVYSWDYSEMPYFDGYISDAVMYVDSDPLLRTKITWSSAQGIYAFLGSYVPPERIDISLGNSGAWENYYFGALPGIDYNYNYIIPKGKFQDYCKEIEAANFKKLEFEDSVLYYVDF
ncbi:MAG: glycosyltransferase family 39 protein [Lachnospiraceae bacterium]|nr:glycosyltransferase family 39 protein [Lachnospiraceae bacterium]